MGLNDGPEKVGFVVYRYMCTNCKWFRSQPYPDWPGRNKTDCYHPVFNKGPFPGYSLGGSDRTPIEICPVLKVSKAQEDKGHV